jgi:HD superfamily phosphohydrolase
VAGTAGTVRRTAKSIYDPVHGTITLDGAHLELISHRAFQRLWGIRQTGFAHLVFPGANHTRLEHSLGVYWVAREMAHRLGLDAVDAATVSAGGLLHDLGHAPFSHTLDATMRESIGVGHEALSRLRIVGEDPSDEVDRETAGPSIPDILERHGIDPHGVADRVDPPAGTRERRPLLRSMLHGAVDCDRIDYLQRDAHYTGVAHGAVDAVRLLDTVRLHSGRLVFAEKGRSAVEGFLVGRTLMYTSVYYHKAVRAAEIMLQSAVERLPGYPDAARALFRMTDGELFAALSRSGERPARLVRGLRDRRLFKRVFGWRELPGRRRRLLLRLRRSPETRRGLEDDLAGAIGAPRGSVLLDIAGSAEPKPADGDLGEIGVLEDGRITRPFRGPSLWRTLALRPPTPWALAVYADPRWRERPASRIARALDRAA